MPTYNCPLLNVLAPVKKKNGDKSKKVFKRRQRIVKRIRKALEAKFKDRGVNLVIKDTRTEGNKEGNVSCFKTEDAGHPMPLLPQY
jgi:F420-0:gamma-glutamyl ligase